jgi:hypothetical protein
VIYTQPCFRFHFLLTSNLCSGGGSRSRGRSGKASPKKSQGPNHYATLGVKSKATPTELKKAYHKLALKYHPGLHALSSVRCICSQHHTLFRR